MHWVIIAVIVVNAALYGILGIRAFLHARQALSPRMRALHWVVVAACAALVLGGVQRLALQALLAGWLTWDLRWVLGEWQLIQSITVLALGLIAWRVLARAEPELRRAEHAERMVTVLTERLPVDRSVSELGLTPRELEVLELIGQGYLSDQALADQLFVSAATVRTHVKNLRRKAGVTNRSQLMFLVTSQGPTAAT